MKVVADLGYPEIVQVLPVNLKDYGYIMPFRQDRSEMQNWIFSKYEVSRETRLRQLIVKVLPDNIQMFSLFMEIVEKKEHCTVW